MKKTVLTAALVLPSLCYSSESVLTAEPTIDNHGFGIGIEQSLSGDGSGDLVYYDFNIDEGTQLHFYFTNSYSKGKTVGGDNLTHVAQNSLGAVYRKIFSYGFYFGLGAEVTRNRFSFTDSYTSRGTTLSHEAYGLNLVPDIGWQGDDGFYLTIGLNTGVQLIEPEKYDETQIADVYNWKDYSNDSWDLLKRKESAYLGVGWYFI